MTPHFKPLHLGISVADINAAIAWYEEKLGFTLLFNKFIPIAHAKIAFLQHGDFELELFEVEGAKPLPEDRKTPNLDIQTHGTKHVAFSVPDMSAWAAALRAKDVDFAMEPRVIEGTPTCFIRDNSGNLLEFIERPEFF